MIRIAPAARARLAVLLLLVGAAACARGREAALPAPIPALDAKPVTAYAFRHVEIAAGTGVPAVHSRCLFAHYTGWLTDGTKFDSSRDTMPDGSPRTPIGFPQGYRRVIPGWDAGFEGMRVGGRRRFLIPYQLGYGERGRPPRIPPRATLVFDVELMAVADTLATSDGVPRAPGQAWPSCPTWAAVAAMPGTR